MKHKIKSLRNYEIYYARSLYYLISRLHQAFLKEAFLTTDASSYVVGDKLSQGMTGKDLTIAYTFRLLNKAEQNYFTIKKELLAIVYSVQFFRLYIYGRKFTLITDHQPLK